MCIRFYSKSLKNLISWTLSKIYPAEKSVTKPSITFRRSYENRPSIRNVYSVGNALRASFRGVGRANNDDAGDLRFKCDQDEKGARGGRRFLSLRKPLTGRTTTGERAGGTHLPFSVLTAAQQGSSPLLFLSLSALPMRCCCSLPPFPLFR